MEHALERLRGVAWDAGRGQPGTFSPPPPPPHAVEWQSRIAVLTRPGQAAGCHPPGRVVARRVSVARWGVRGRRGCVPEGDRPVCCAAAGVRDGRRAAGDGAQEQLRVRTSNFEALMEERWHQFQELSEGNRTLVLELGARLAQVQEQVCGADPRLSGGRLGRAGGVCVPSRPL